MPIIIAVGRPSRARRDGRMASVPSPETQECPLGVLVVCKQMGQYATVIANHCRRPMFSHRIVQ